MVLANGSQEVVTPRGTLASVVNCDKCWTVLGTVVFSDKMTVSPGLGLAVLIR